MASFRQVLKLALDFQDLIDDPNSPSRAEIVSNFKVLIQELANNDDAALGAMVDEMALAARNKSFFGSGSKQ
jgi:hypothetical protein